LMTLGVYGLVAGIVKLDDLGLYLSRGATAAGRAIGTTMLRAAPWLLKGLAVAGTGAMHLVGGGNHAHGFHARAERVAEAAGGAAAVRGIGAVLGALTSMLANVLVGIVAGAVGVGVVMLVRRLRGAPTSPGPA